MMKPLVLKYIMKTFKQMVVEMEKVKNILMGLGLAAILYVWMIMMFVMNETGSGF